MFQMAENMCKDRVNSPGAGGGVGGGTQQFSCNSRYVKDSIENEIKEIAQARLRRTSIAFLRLLDFRK